MENNIYYKDKEYDEYLKQKHNSYKVIETIPVIDLLCRIAKGENINYFRGKDGGIFRNSLVGFILLSLEDKTTTKDVFKWLNENVEILDENCEQSKKDYEAYKKYLEENKNE